MLRNNATPPFPNAVACTAYAPQLADTRTLECRFRRSGKTCAWMSHGDFMCEERGLAEALLARPFAPSPQRAVC